LDFFLKKKRSNFFMIWNGQYGIARCWVIKNHVASFPTSEIITDFTECFNCASARNIGKRSQFISSRQVCLQNIPERAQPEYASLFLWQHEANRGWPHEYYGVRPLWFYPETYNLEVWDIRQHSPGNQNHMLIQREISCSPPPL